MVYTLNPLMENESIRILSMKREELGFYVSPEHPMAGKVIREEDLKDVPLLLTGHNCNFRHMLISDLEKKGILPKIVLETSSKEILKQFAVNELGIAFMPEMTVRKDLEKHLLVKLDWAGHDFPICSRVFIHKDKHVSPAIRELVEILRRSE